MFFSAFGKGIRQYYGGEVVFDLVHVQPYCPLPPSILSSPLLTPSLPSLHSSHPPSLHLHSSHSHMPTVGEDQVPTYYYAIFGLWIIFAILSAGYSFAWDIKMDWGLFEGKYITRSERIYSRKVTYSTLVHVRGEDQAIRTHRSGRSEHTKLFDSGRSGHSKARSHRFMNLGRNQLYNLCKVYQQGLAFETLSIHTTTKESWGCVHHE